MKFAAFIMTYKRPEIAKQTIDILLQQTVKPEKILIVDNDPENSAQILSNAFPDENIEYYSVGYNSGPAGAAAIGLQKLSDQGYDWISWIDDDDPPVYPDMYERLLKITMTHPNVGCVGAVGQFFNFKTGIVNRVPNNLLLNDGIIEVNTIAGGMIKIVNGAMIRQHKILPDSELFFGFEELDFDIKIKKLGYRLLVDKSIFLSLRKKYNRDKDNIIIYKKKDSDHLWRDYYSSRNLLKILFKQKSFLAFFVVILRMLNKSIISFTYGYQYGSMNLRFQCLAIIHFLKGKFGKAIFLIL